MPIASTHEVFNQSPPFVNVNLFTTDPALQEAVRREGAAESQGRLAAFGSKCGSAEAVERGRLANEYPPKLKTFDAKGYRLDMVEYHPAYHECMGLSFAEGLHCSAWDHLAKPDATPVPGANVARSAATYMATQMEAGHQCPITMTNAAVPTLMLTPQIATQWLPKILSRSYDPRFQRVADKTSVTIGMGMTEKQGGTDVRANTTRAEPGGGGPGQEYRITGHKWFISAPMCDAFLVLAQAPRGLSCFLVSRILPDGTVNALRFQRLKDKLGNRSNASSEVEFVGALGQLVGEEGRGVPSIIEMVTCTRLDCAIGSAGLMRISLVTAIHHARHRTVFQKKLVDQPIMEEVLADLALDVEAATALSFRLARSFDRAHSDPSESAWRRVMTPVTKYWVCKMTPPFVYEAMECLGGNGYVEDGLVARIYREAPVNAIWEGSGNVMALDLLRVLAREREAVDMVIEALAQVAGDDKTIKSRLARIRDGIADLRLTERRGRALIEGLAVVAAATILREDAPAAVADAFLATRLSAERCYSYGQGLEAVETRAIVDRALAA